MTALILPGSEEFERTARVLDFKKPTSVEAEPASTTPPAPPTSLVGRTLMLNTAKARGFQCGGFQLSLNRPHAVVDERAQQDRLFRAIEDGLLIDVTDQDPKKGFLTPDGGFTKVDQQDTGKMVFVAHTPTGRAYVVIPKNKTEQTKFERELKRTGTITVPNTAQIEEAPGLSAITAETVTLDADGRIPHTSQGPTSGRTSRRQRKSERQ